jgi:dienelactone hydrolase
LRRRGIATALGAGLLLAGCGGASPTRIADAVLDTSPPPLGAAQTLQVPMTDGIGRVLLLTTRVCRPEGTGPFRLAIVNHPGAAAERARADMAPEGCGAALPAWLLARGYVVALPLRRGYGGSGSGAGWVADPGSCARPDYVRSGIEAARDIAAVADFLEKSPDVRSGGLVVAGEDEGGWAAVAFGSLPENTDLAAVVNFGGGMGGNAAAQAGHVCRPDLLADAAAAFGRTSRVRSLWVYAADDPVFPPDLARSLAAAFRQAGGTAQVASPDAPDGTDRHLWAMTAAGEAVWAPLLEDFIPR